MQLVVVEVEVLVVVAEVVTVLGVVDVLATRGSALPCPEAVAVLVVVGKWATTERALPCSISPCCEGPGCTSTTMALRSLMPPPLSLSIEPGRW
mmetsp:Transcript_116073/g.315184  ORF Transcript_116073/g.315184 Transcript_116073/m.315184 type:complete len:94 (-) Transcript_116073:249-530(-)